jgi:hypothetical protein
MDRFRKRGAQLLQKSMQSQKVSGESCTFLASADSDHGSKAFLFVEKFRRIRFISSGCVIHKIPLSIRSDSSHSDDCWRMTTTYTYFVVTSEKKSCVKESAMCHHASSSGDDMTMSVVVVTIAEQDGGDEDGEKRLRRSHICFHSTSIAVMSV